MDVGVATDSDYAGHLHSLAPRGPAWPEDTLLQAAAVELSRIHNRALDLIEEADPRSTGELLTDWERVAALPDPCVSEDQVLQQRIDALVRKLRMIGGASRQYWIDLAATFGVEITITEFDAFTVISSVADPIYGEEWRFAWQVNMPTELVVTAFNVISGVDEPLAAWEEGVVECMFGHLKQAQTRLFFVYA